MNSYKIEIETVNGAIKRATVSANTRNEAYRFIVDSYPTANVLNIVRAN